MHPVVAVSTAVVLALLATAGAPAVAAGDADLSARVDETVRQQMAQHDLPGLAVVVVVDGEVVHRGGYGEADTDGTPVTTGTPFVLASTSKQLTGLLVQDLVVTGELTLGTTVHSLLPWFGDGDDRHSRVTVGHLLGHTSGFTQSDDMRAQGRAAEGESLEVRARRLGTFPLAHEPGTTFEYSNGSYDLLGHLVEVVHGRPYEEVLRTRVLEPLGMTATTTDLERAREAGLAQGHYPWFGIVTRPTDDAFVPGAAPSAGVVSTADDLTALVLAHLDPDGAGALGPVVAAAAQPVHQVDDDVGYASGWWVHPFWSSATADQDDSTLPTARSHDGSMSAYRSQLVVVPETGFGLVLLTNSGDVVRPHVWGGVVDAVTRAALGLPAPPAWSSGDPVRDNATVVMLGIPLLQVLAGVGLLLARGRRGWPAALVGASVVNVLALGFVLVYVPQQYDAPLRLQPLAAPDVAVLTGSVVVLAGATVVQVVLLRRATRAATPSRTTVSPKSRSAGS